MGKQKNSMWLWLALIGVAGSFVYPWVETRYSYEQQLTLMWLWDVPMARWIQWPLVLGQSALFAAAGALGYFTGAPGLEFPAPVDERTPVKPPVE